MADSQRRDEWCWLLEAHGDALWALVRKLCKHWQDAEDAFQEAAARAWKHWPGRKEIGNPRAWLMTIGYRTFLDLRSKTTVGEGGGDAVTEAADRRTAGPAAAAVAQEEACRVRAAVAALADDVREVFVLHYTAGLSIADAADAMGIKTGTAKSRLNAGLNELRRMLS
jgi:RNA polymerase sigma-70 factor (ECF subfamily)